MRHKKKDIVYSINVDDLHKVASRVLERSLTDEEVESVANALGNFIDWFQAIQNAIETRVTSPMRSG